MSNSKYILRHALAWLIMGAIIANVIVFGPSWLTAIRGGGDCLTQYIVPPITAVVKNITGQSQDAAWVIKNGELYLVTRTGAVKLCATGDPETPTFEARK